ncbi:glycosyltransferase family 4 protein [Knoellia subterranea]|uniref:D-inositol 3-phosphate glycosyltransferase n=1 Tax=Knoellia subterranea KCTC 19937 TaxID=1385521 RepID=A0A0A0JMY0_9MICO|nr:glycosyltransferase family 4 protein [Knoellia subterranea]KGN38805.1 glycosyl transferase [Knoellia subterranea KCTC 19937]
MPLRVLLLNWRDMHHPEAGGAEKYLVTVAEGLAARGHEITFRTAAYPGAVAEEVVNGVRYIRRGGRLGIYPRALMANLVRRYDVDVVVDVQNGMPYLSPLTRRPVVNLVHHVHKEQWPVVFGPRLAKAGWWLESRLAPIVYRRTDYVAVSDATKAELAGLGVRSPQIQVIHNGTDHTPAGNTPRSTEPTIIVLGRLVPQKRVEIALETLDRLRDELPTLTLDIVGSGWWDTHLHEKATALGLNDRVTFHGHVSEAEKHRLLARAWVHAMPSLKEGWGLVVVEAGVHGTPTVAFSEAGGPTNSIVHGRTGLLVDQGVDAFVEAVRLLLTDDALRHDMSQEVAQWVTQFHWDESVDRWERALTAAASRRC